MKIGIHQNVQRFFDEYCCADCGRSWAVDDHDVPETCQAQLLDHHGKVMDQVARIKEADRERSKRKS